MRNPLQEQMLKAGLVKKGQVAKVVRDQAQQRKGKAPAARSDEQVQIERVQLERAERDRALAAERNALARAVEQRAQIRQIIDCHKVPRDGELVYRFTDGDVIGSVLVNESLRAQLAAGTLAIARHEHGYELLPRMVVEKIEARDPAAIVVDHARSASASESFDDDYYAQFKVPDDLVW